LGVGSVGEFSMAFIDVQSLGVTLAGLGAVGAVVTAVLESALRYRRKAAHRRLKDDAIHGARFATTLSESTKLLKAPENWLLTFETLKNQTSQTSTKLTQHEGSLAEQVKEAKPARERSALKHTWLFSGTVKDTEDEQSSGVILEKFRFDNVAAGEKGLERRGRADV
jgi:hypothetical protein